jgi:lipopolysaccharide/colanic/teichoic acid biosynthesis glycosyltransferase
MLKRTFDVVMAGLGLLLLAPLLLAVALWVKLDSKGPVLFRQERVGRAGRPFFIHKFRTMRADVSGQAAQITVGADPRITSAGQVLRRCKLDELPQLWDVLRGAMSLVGPRPEVPKYVALYPAAMRQLVLSIRPGITDLASIEYRDESALLAEASDPELTYTQVILPAKLALAARYVQTRSFVGDLRLLLRTLKVIAG